MSSRLLLNPNLHVHLLSAVVPSSTEHGGWAADIPADWTGGSGCGGYTGNSGRCAVITLADCVLDSGRDTVITFALCVLDSGADTVLTLAHCVLDSGGDTVIFTCTLCARQGQRDCVLNHVDSDRLGERVGAASIWTFSPMEGQV